MDNVADKEAPSVSKASKARLMSEAEARKKDKQQQLSTKKMQAMLKEMSGTEPQNFKIDHKATVKDALNRVQQKVAIRKIDLKVKLKLENEKTQDQLNTFEASEVEETKAPSRLSMKLDVISGQTFDMMPQGSLIQSIISVAEHRVIRIWVKLRSSP